MRIGILTFWGVPNYGCFFQAYASQKAVSQLYPDAQVEVIPYLNKHHYAMYYKIVQGFSPRALLQPNFYKNVFERSKQFSAIREMKGTFLDCYQELSGSNRMSEDGLQKRHYDTVILGSDIIWDYTIPFFGQDKFLFGNGLNADRVISYAASFGTAPADGELPEFAKEGINQLSAISVRDLKSCAIIGANFDRPAVIMPDPTILWDFSNDERFAQQREYGDYIVVYGSTFPDEMISEVTAYKKKHGLKLICLDSGGDSHDWCDVNIAQDELDPYSWAVMIKNANAIMTCTFHGLLFGLLFRKPIAFHATEFIMPKISAIIKDLEIEEPLLERKRFDDKINWDWNYERIDARMEDLRRKGIGYLSENLRR